ncbi:MAG: glycerate kinase, partial [Actinobacteria bacterium]|nr:glycerate kinase [Actinomycetota bacterium]
IDASWVLLADRVTAVVEVAEASGLALLAPHERDPARATTFGTGQLIAAAAAKADRVLVAVGGSATNDGGRGALEAIAEAGGALQGVDLVPGAGSEGKRVREFTIDARDQAHWEQILRAIGSTRGARVLEYVDRTLAMHRGGKIAVVSTVPVETRADLSLAYTPGVARICTAIADEPDLAYDYTWKSHTVAVVTDGTAVLGLGDIGPAAALPVMEGKALLFKQFKLLCFDAGYASSQGWPTVLLDVVMMALVVTVTVIGLQAVGLILIIALLIIPAAAARFWTERLLVMTFIAAGIGAASSAVGAAGSALLPMAHTAVAGGVPISPSTGSGSTM